MPGKRVTGEQSRRMSLVEAIINVAIGYAIAVVTNWLVLPLFGFAVSVGDSAAIGAIFTAVAIVRSYVLRRVFEAIRIRGAQMTTAGHEHPAATRGEPADQAAFTIR